MKIFIIHPDTREPVSLASWLKDPDPMRAQFLAILFGRSWLVFPKAPVGHGPFLEAQALASATDVGDGSLPFACPTRRDALDLADADIDGDLAAAISAIGGSTAGNSFWTSETVPDSHGKRDSIAWAYSRNGQIWPAGQHGVFYALPVARVGGGLFKDRP